MKKILFLAILLQAFICGSGLYASGNSGINSLDLDATGARQFAMAEASTGLAGDVNTLTVNPAGLSILTSPEASFMYVSGFEGTGYFYAAAASPLPAKNGVLGISFLDYSVSPFQGINESGTATENMTMNDYALSLAYSCNLFKLFSLDQDLHLGASAKYGSSKIYTVTKSFYAFDAGLLYSYKFSGFFQKEKQDVLSAGISVQNLGPDVVYVAEGTKLPQKLRTGLGFETSLSKALSLRTALDYINEPESGNNANIGVEVLFLSMYAVRAGYKISQRETDSFTAGAGAALKIASHEIRMDYAVIPMGDLGLSHVVSIGFKF